MILKILLSLLLILGFGMLGFGLFQAFSQPMKVGWQFKNPYFLSSYDKSQKLIIKKGLIKLLLGAVILVISGSGLNYLENGKLMIKKIQVK